LRRRFCRPELNLLSFHRIYSTETLGEGCNPKRRAVMHAKEEPTGSHTGRGPRQAPISRRDFLKGVASGGAVLAATPLFPSSALSRSMTVGPKRPHAQEVRLFNGADLSGWEYFLEEDGARMEDVWSVDEGILVCKGEPRGHLHTAQDYESFKLVVEWRWPGEPGNSGVLMRITGEPAMLPNCVEAQLRSGSAGDMYGFNGFRIGGDPARLSERSIGWSLTRIEGNEKEPGEWNRYEITAEGERITVILNGKLVNEATGCDVRPGRIGLQSEGGVIHFRTVTLTPLSP
jgi:hypothetical protein